MSTFGRVMGKSRSRGELEEGRLINTEGEGNGPLRLVMVSMDVSTNGSASGSTG